MILYIKFKNQVKLTMVIGIMEMVSFWDGGF